ncbi:hypothetical protein [Mycobacteroides abscessus]|uniref:hypothetical protein n=1 Tax=Mycobacteroides abscessus TaxID=36809 RepID=UPI0009A71B80|nr:hypothetical protein [Mycobacteroides abscessus]SKO15480.1 Uncharacterised protein [Mycobacteroides abscessus subsp. bolletii]SKX37312.1 Uncharacterised protein [Mycobacteroides abscessus subsp. bolletii]
MKLLTDSPRSAIIDWLAVDQVSQHGQRLPLREPERSEVVRRLYGHIDDELLADRLYISSRTLTRLAIRLGLATKTVKLTEPTHDVDQPLAPVLAAAA